MASWSKHRWNCSSRNSRGSKSGTQSQDCRNRRGQTLRNSRTWRWPKPCAPRACRHHHMIQPSETGQPHFPTGWSSRSASTPLSAPFALQGSQWWWLSSHIHCESATKTKASGASGNDGIAPWPSPKQKSLGSGCVWLVMILL